jgi:MerR family transcriptional regulator/heat shock protein HspR
MNSTDRGGEGMDGRLPRPHPFPDAAAPLYTVGQVAGMLGVQPAFLRRLDTENVVSPSRSAGGQRRYSRLEIQHIYALTGLLDEGLTLAGAKRIIELQALVDDLRRQLEERPQP